MEIGNGSTVLLLPEDHPLSALVELTPGGEVSAMIELADTAPVAMRRPVCGLLWITGWLRALSPKQAQHVAMDVAPHRYDHRLLDVGYGSMLPLPQGVRTRVCPLSVDRLGLQLRIEDGEQAHDLRLAFQRPATNPVQLATELHRLAGCPAVTLGLRPPGADRERRT